MSEEEEVLHKLESTKERVLYILEHYPEARNDDLYLWLIYVRLFSPELSKYISYIPYEVLKKAPKFETIRRVRQHIQNTLGLYPPTREEVMRRRRIRERAMRRIFGRGDL